MSSAARGEREPLLNSPVQTVSDDHARTCWPYAEELPFAKSRVSSKRTQIVTCVFCLQFLFNFSRYIVEIPLIRLFEIAICNRYFDARAIKEEECKVPPIQDDLAMIVGWRFFFDAIPGLLTAIFYGRLADRNGRRIVLLLSCSGLLCSLVWMIVVCYANKVLPIKLVWASSAFILVVSLMSIGRVVVH